MKVSTFDARSHAGARRQEAEVRHIDTQVSRRPRPALEGMALADTYEVLKQLHNKQQAISPAELMQWLKERRDSEGVSLGKDGPTMLDAISALRIEAMKDKQTSASLRRSLERACSHVVAFDGFLASFRMKMLQPPDVPEPW